MKKQLSLLALLALGISFASAATLDLGLVFDQQREFGYTENQNIRVEGFKTTDTATTPEFFIKTPILKDAKDVAVGEYYILLGKQPIKNYLTGEGVSSLRQDLLELPPYTTMDLEGELELKVNDTLLEKDQSYYGVVVPQDDNVIPGKYSKEFCFNFSTQEYAEGTACESFKLPEGVKVAGLEASELSAVESELEHDAAGADMRLADISHSVQGNTITLTWTAVPGSENLEIQLFDKEKADYVTLATVPMSQEKYEYTYSEGVQEFLFAFIPRDSKGKEVRYDVNVRHETDITPVVDDVSTGPVENMFIILAITLVLYSGYRVFAARKV